MSAFDAIEDSKSSAVSLIGERNTPLHVCSIESLKGSLFLCGAYELQEGGEGLESGCAGRLGSLTIYDGGATVAKWSEGGRSRPCEIVEVGSCEMDGGVLDCKVLGGDVVGTALSSGCLRIDKMDNLDNGEGNVHFSMLAEARREEEGLFLSVDWEPGPLALTTNNSSVGKIVTSTQQSSLLLFDVSCLNADSDPLVHIRDAHEFTGEAVPAWITAFDPHNPSRILSGGDDCALKAWDLRSSCLIAKNTKSHDAGVTSIQFHPQREHLFASGSYDENVRVWDGRMLAKPVATLYVGGGVWRTKWFGASHSDSLALACMQAGSCVAEYVHDDNAACAHLQSNIMFPDKMSLAEKHLAYGIAPLLDLGDGGGDFDSLITSCSFYENTVSLWAY